MYFTWLRGTGFLAFARHAHDDALLVVLGNQAGEIAAVLRHDGRHLIGGADDEAGIEHVREQLLERGAAIGRDVGADFPALAVNRVALRAEIAKDGLAAMRIADVFAEIRGHFGHDLFALGISLFANFAEGFLDRPQRIAIVALQNLSQVIRVEHAFGQLVREHGIEKFPRPALALHDQINRQRLQFRARVSGIRPSRTSASFGSSTRPSEAKTR